MNLDQYVLLAAFSYLRASDSLLPNIKKFLINSPYDFLTPRALGKCSIAAIDESGEEIGFFSWANSLKAEGIKEISITRFNNVRADVDERISAGFLGGVLDCFLVKTERSTRAYVLNPVSGSRYQATEKDFIFLVNKQDDLTSIKDKMLILLHEHLSLNQIFFDPNATFENLLTHTKGLWESMADRLFESFQIHLIQKNKPFIAPKHLEKLFVKPDRSMLKVESKEKEFVYFYHVKDVSPQQCVDLILAQNNPVEVRMKIAELVRTWQIKTEVDFNSENWSFSLISLDGGQFEEILPPIERAISDVCTEAELKPMIPKNQETLWGPDEAEIAVIKARGKVNEEGFYLAPNENPFLMYCFTPTSHFKNSPDDEDLQGENILSVYQKSLKAIEEFANKIRSPFSDIFRLSQLVLSEPLPSSGFGLETDVKSWNQFLLDHGLNEMSQEELAQYIGFLLDLKQLALSEDEIKIFLSYSISSVFGGMGSWNDQGFSDDQARIQYEELSDSLYQSRKKIFSEALNFRI